MGLLFKPRRKTSAPSSHSEAALAVQDLSDLVNSYCIHTELPSVRDSRSAQLASPTFPSGNYGDALFATGSPKANQHFCSPCRCIRCSRQSEHVQPTWRERRRTLQVIEYHIDQAESTELDRESASKEQRPAPPRTAFEEVLIALTICLGSCICAHLTFDTVIGLEQFRWMNGLTKTIKLSIVLYIILRAHSRLVLLFRKFVNCVELFGSTLTTFWRSLPRFLITDFAFLSDDVTSSNVSGAGPPKPQMTASAPPGDVLSEHVLREISTHLPGLRTSSSSDCENVLHIAVTEDSASWDLDVPAEGPAGRLQCNILGKIRLTEIK